MQVHPSARLHGANPEYALPRADPSYAKWCHMRLNTQALLRLACSLELLGAPAQHQMDYLTRLGVGDLLDELALEFSDRYFPLAEPLRQVMPEVATVCDALMRTLSNRDLGWRYANLSEPAWEAVRASAREALTQLRDAGVQRSP